MRRGATNVVATMLIFGIMITSMGALYAQIAPTLLGYESQTTTTNQRFIMQTVANEVMDLSSSTEGSQTRVHIFSEDTAYDVSDGQALNVSIINNGVTESTQVHDIGLFTGTVTGSFQPSGSAFVNRVLSEDSYVVNDTDDSPANYVAKSEYDYTEGIFSLYFRARLTVTEVSDNNYLITVLFLQMDYLEGADGSPVSFPVEKDEWSLRLRRQASTVIESPSFTANGVDAISMTQYIDGNPGTSYSFSGIEDGASVTVRTITVPILFTI